MEHKSTILIVDDEPIGRETLKAMLRTQGHIIEIAQNGVEALEMASALTPDLILLDVMMPGMDGYDVCRRLRADPLLAEVPVIMVTALDDRDSRLEGIEAGADDFISKPFDRVELRTRVQTIIRLNRYRRLLAERTHRQMAEEGIRRRNSELTLLNRVIVAASSGLDIAELLNTVCEALVHTLELSRALAMLVHDAQARPGATAQYPPPASPPSAINPIIGDTAFTSIQQHRGPLIIDTCRFDPQLEYARNRLARHGIAALLVVPILVADQAAGYIELHSQDQRVFSAQDLALAQSVALAVGQAMQTAHLYQRLQQHADNLEAVVARRTRELQTERDRTQAILEALGEAVVVTDTNDLIQYMNPAAVALTGFTSEEAIGQSPRLWQSEYQVSASYDQIQAIVRSGQTWRGETVNRRKDGTLYSAALTVAPLFDIHTPGRPIGFVSVQRDITPLKEAEHLKNQFVSNVSHELRTPLSIITLLSGNLDTLYDRLDDTKRRKMIRDIREHTRVLDELIGDVLEIARIDSQRISTAHQPVNLAQLVREEADKQMPLAHKKSQRLSITGTEHLVVRGNDGQLRQVIRNLLNNAIKYTPKDGRIVCECCVQSDRPDAGTVWPVRVESPGSTWAVLRVSDTGRGIGPEHIPHIFERFYRVEPQGNISGTGLGLSIAQELVSLHAGFISVATTPGEGSTFAVYLPILEEE